MVFARSGRLLRGVAPYSRCDHVCGRGVQAPGADGTIAHTGGQRVSQGTAQSGEGQGPLVQSTRQKIIGAMYCGARHFGVTSMAEAISSP